MDTELTGTQWRGASGAVFTVERVEGGMVYGRDNAGLPWGEHVDWLYKLYVQVA